MSANVDKTFNSPGAFESLISNAQTPNTQSENIENNQLQEPALTKDEIIKNKKLDYLKQLSNQGLINIECNSTGCVSLTEGIGMKGEHVINAEYIVDKDSVKPFKPDATLSGTTTYKADTFVKTRQNYHGEVKNHKGTMELNIDNRTGMGNAKTSVDNLAHERDFKSINKVDITYDNIDYTKENFGDGSHVQVEAYQRGRDESSSMRAMGDISGTLSGESNSNGKFDANIIPLDQGTIEIKGIFSGKEKTVNKHGYVDCMADPNCPK